MSGHPVAEVSRQVYSLALWTKADGHRVRGRGRWALRKREL